MKKRNRCDCCGYYTLIGENEDILWDICPVCYWENDVTGIDINEYSGANHMTLKQGQENYKMCSACDHKMVKYVRMPETKELPENNVINK